MYVTDTDPVADLGNCLLRYTTFHAAIRESGLKERLHRRGPSIGYFRFRWRSLRYDTATITKSPSLCYDSMVWDSKHQSYRVSALLNTIPVTLDDRKTSRRADGITASPRLSRVTVERTDTTREKPYFRRTSLTSRTDGRN